MATPSSERARPYADRTLAVYLDGFAEGRRALWIGPADTGGAEQLATSARAVLVLDPTGQPKPGRRGRLRVGELQAGPLTFREGSFDVAVVPDVTVLGDDLGLSGGELERLRDSGVIR